MMGKNSLRKGNRLEEAVSTIEEIIFKMNPSLRESNFKIERKKIIITDGVKHEIDLFVEIDSGNNYISIFIFECKNWDHKAIGKNEIIEFSEKIKVTNAQKGFFIAKNYGKYCIAQAKKDNRMELLLANDFKLDISPFPPSHLLFHDKSKSHTDIKLFRDVGIDPSTLNREKETLNIDIKKSYLNGEEINFKEYILGIADKFCEKSLNKEPTQTFDEGEHSFNISKDIIFTDGNKLTVNDIDICLIEMSVSFTIFIGKPKVVSNFEIENRGRVIDTVYEVPNYGKLNIKLINLK